MNVFRHLIVRSPLLVAILFLAIIIGAQLESKHDNYRLERASSKHSIERNIWDVEALQSNANEAETFNNFDLVPLIRVMRNMQYKDFYKLAFTDIDQHSEEIHHQSLDIIEEVNAANEEYPGSKVQINGSLEEIKQELDAVHSQDFNMLKFLEYSYTSNGGIFLIVPSILFIICLIGLFTTNFSGPYRELFKKKVGKSK